jgi:hypothetical protein
VNASQYSARAERFNQYPLLEYKNIAYFPMTWDYGELLNLNTSWSQEKGLEIGQGDPGQWKFFQRDENRDTRNGIYQTARIADSPVTVNGKPIDNAKEEYPLLVFRDVTYFPLTWRFAVDEFGWRYLYDDSKGLLIDADNAVIYCETVPNPQEFYAWFWPVPASPASGAGTVWHHVYVRDGLKIWLEFHAPSKVMGYGLLFISTGGDAALVGEKGLDNFTGLNGGADSMGVFRVEGEWIYTRYNDLRPDYGLKAGSDPARVNIWTKEIEIMK